MMILAWGHGNPIALLTGSLVLFLPEFLMLIFLSALAEREFALGVVDNSPAPPPLKLYSDAKSWNKGSYGHINSNSGQESAGGFFEHSGG